jgi:hypothetical protein
VRLEYVYDPGVTDVSSKLNVTVSVAVTALVSAVPPTKVIVFPVPTICVAAAASEIIKSLIVPGADPEAASVSLPCGSTVKLEYVYDPGVTDVSSNVTVTVSVAAATVVSPVPPAMVIVS